MTDHKDGEPLPAGAVLGERYRVVRLLGKGGMGEVYLADDLQQSGNGQGDNEDGRVAVKVARFGIPRRAVQRLRTEYRILAQLDHPAIARVLDAGSTDDDRPFFVMEHIQGTQIEEYCAAHELSARDRVGLIMKVCDAVEAAHRHDVVHRDLKPSNILVTPEGEPKLLDFGIAKLLAPEALTFTVEATRTHEEPLTPQYASPEQIHGDPITARTDVYALGVVLYKLLTGRLPYSLERYSRVAMARAFDGGSPPRPSTLVDASTSWEVAGELDATVMKALSVQPEDRFDSVSDLVDALKRWMEGRQSAALSAAGRLRTLRVRLGGRRGAFSMVLLLLTIAVLWFVGAWPDLPSRSPVASATTSLKQNDQAAVVVGEFRNLTGEMLLDGSLRTVFRLGIEQSRFVKVISWDNQQRRSQIQPGGNPALDRETGILVARREGAGALVLGTVAKKEDGYHLSADLVDPASGRAVFQASARAVDREATVSAIEEVLVAIRHRLGEPPESVRATPPLEKIFSKDLRAVRAYAIGFDRHNENDFELAIGFFRRAISIDPDFAMAHARLGTALRNLQRPGAAVHWARALQRPDRLTEFETLYTRGWLFMSTGSPEESIAVWRQMTDSYPERNSGYFNLGMSLIELGYDPLQGAAVFEKGIRSVPEFRNQFLVRLAWARIVSEDIGGYRSAIQSFPQESRTEWQLIALLMGTIFDRLSHQTETLLEETRLIEARDEFVYSAIYFSDFGRLRDAISAVEIYREQRSDRSPLLDEAITILELSIPSQGPEVSDEQLLDLYEKAEGTIRNPPRGINFVEIPGLAILGKVLARHGAVQQAERMARLLGPVVQSNPLPLWMSYWHVLEGEILAARGRQREAVSRFREALDVQENFQVHESLAQAFEDRGELTLAIEESEWLVEHRGQALFGAGGLSVNIQNVIDWNYALLRLARLHDRLGEKEKAIARYRQFVDNWREGDRPVAWHQAVERLRMLDPGADDLM